MFLIFCVREHKGPDELLSIIPTTQDKLPQQSKTGRQIGRDQCGMETERVGGLFEGVLLKVNNEGRVYIDMFGCGLPPNHPSPQLRHKQFRFL